MMLSKGFLLLLLLVLVLLLLVSNHLAQGQRSFEPCLSEDLLRNCKYYDKPEIDWDMKEMECETIIVDYFFEDYFLVEDPDERVKRLGGIPANTDVCETLERVFIHCYWCEIEVNCFENYTLSCEDGVLPIFPELQDAEKQDIQGEDIDWIELHDLCTELTEELLGHEWDQDYHYELLVNEHVVKESPEWCSKLRWAYSQCYWCKTGTAHNPQDYCSVQDWCRETSQDTNDTTNNTSVVDYANAVGVEETCQELDTMLKDFWKKTPMTHHQCDRAEMAVKHGGPCRQRQCEPCFDIDSEEDYRALCQNLDHSKESLQEWPPEEVVGACWDIWFEFHLDPYNSTYHALRLGQLRAADEQCRPRFQQVYSSCYWCNQDLVKDKFPCDQQATCRHAPLPLDEMDPALRAEFGTGEAICDELRLLPTINMFPTTADLCLKAQKFSQYCACSKVVDNVPFDYLGADTQAKRNALIWISRVAAFLSLAGGVYILWDSLFHDKKRRTAYHQLLTGMAIFDICTAVAWSFATTPIDATDVDGKGYNFEGAKGTKATCNAQAFFIQLGVTSIFYNVSLATYYVLVIVHGKREMFLQRTRPYMHGIPIVAGCGLALGGLTEYGNMGYGCHISPLPASDLSTVLIFVGLPIGLSICYITLAMLRVYCSVQAKSRASRRWRIGVGSSNSLEYRVFWQAVCYTLSFYVTWPIVFCVYFGELDNKKYWFAVLVAFVAPLQGFNNFLVYIKSQYVGRQAKISRSSSTFAMISNQIHSWCCPCLPLSLPDQEECDCGLSPAPEAASSSDLANIEPERATEFKEQNESDDAAPSENAANSFLERFSGMDPSVVIASEESEATVESVGVSPIDEDAPIETTADHEGVKAGIVQLGDDP